MVQWIRLGAPDPRGLSSIPSQGADGDCSHDVKRRLLLGRKVMTNLDAAAAAKSLQSCPILCDPTDGSPPDFPVPGIPRARTLEWVAISFSNAESALSLAAPILGSRERVCAC